MSMTIVLQLDVSEQEMISDYENLKKELEQGTLSLKEVKACVKHLLNIILLTEQYKEG
jgi:hypothetical protein